MTGELEFHDVPGNHLTMVFEPHVRTLAAQLAKCLDRARMATHVNGGGKAA